MFDFLIKCAVVSLSCLPILACAAQTGESVETEVTEAADTIDGCPSERTCTDCTRRFACGWCDGRCVQARSDGPTTGTCRGPFAFLAGQCGGGSGGGSGGGASTCGVCERTVPITRHNTTGRAITSMCRGSWSDMQSECQSLCVDHGQGWRNVGTGCWLH